MMDDSSEKSIPFIDFESITLTPEQAILCLEDKVEVLLPVPTARACNNLDEYLMKSTSSAKKTQRNAANGQDDKVSHNESSKNFLPTFSKEPFAVPLERNFDRILRKPDGKQSTSTTNDVPKRSKPDVFSRVETFDKTSGPIQLLKTRMNKTVKVTIRRRRKVPYISRVIEYKGILTMFDKHMNLYLRDVIESFKYSVEDKILKRARHRNNILVRGDNVIFIT